MSEIKYESASVQSYLGILQGVINRMAANSASCKTWCIALVSAIIVIIADKGNADYVLISVFPIVLFLFLDSYYLGLERGFVAQYNDFVKKIHDGTAKIDDLFIVTPKAGKLATLKAIGSPAVWPFYGLLVAMLLIVRYWLLSCS